MEKNHTFMGNKNPLKLTLNERQLWVHTKIIVHLSVSFSAPAKQCLNISIKGVALIKALDFWIWHELGSILLTNTRVTSIYQSPLSMCIISISDWLILCQLSSKILLSVSTVWELLTIQTISFANYYVLFLDTWHRYTLSGCLGENKKKAFTKALKW